VRHADEVELGARGELAQELERVDADAGRAADQRAQVDADARSPGRGWNVRTPWKCGGEPTGRMLLARTTRRPPKLTTAPGCGGGAKVRSPNDMASDIAPPAAAAPAGSTPAAASDPERERAAEALAGLRAAIRQRQGEAATIRAGADELHGLLLELQRHEFVEEPAPVSPRPVYGRLLVFLRKAGYHLFFKWHARAVLAQQNAFNQSASRLILELAERHRRAEEELAKLRREVDSRRSEPREVDSRGLNPRP
jgi:hypothetical protein